MDIKVHHTGSTGNLYQVDDLLIDPGVSIKKIKKALNFKLSEISACLVSHSHKDHCKGLYDVMRCAVKSYMLESVIHDLDLYGLPHLLRIVKEYEQFEIGPWKVKAFPLVHDVPNVGYLIAKGKEKLLYTCDTNYIPFRFKDLTHIMIGIDYDAETLKDNVATGSMDPELAKRILKNHMSLETAIGFFKANDILSIMVHPMQNTGHSQVGRQVWAQGWPARCG